MSRNFPAIPAYTGSRRPPRNFNRTYQEQEWHSTSMNEPPDITSRNLFANPTYEQMERIRRAKMEEEKERRIRQQIEENLRREQEKTSEGWKQVTLDDEDDEDFVPMGTVQSMYNPQPVEKVVYIIERPKKKKKKSSKKKKHRKRSSSSSSASSEEGTSRRKRRRHNSDIEELVEISDSYSSERVQEIYTEFDFRKNPWHLLRKPEYIYKPSHLVVQKKGDPDNFRYDEPYKNDIADYRNINNNKENAIRALSEIFRRCLLGNIGDTLISKDQRSHADIVIKNWNKCPVERIFRQKKEEVAFMDFTPLSHQCCTVDDEAASIFKSEALDANQLSRMDSDDFNHYVQSQQISYEESLNSNIEGQYSILHNKVTMNKHDIDSWIEFINIQQPYQAKIESGNPNAVIQNQKAFYERVSSVVNRAIQNNPGNPKLHIKRIKIMEKYLGITSKEVTNEWKSCENKFVNNIAMWREKLKMLQNDRTSFTLEKMIIEIDRCIHKLVLLKNGQLVSHKMEDGTEEFLVELLVQRCRLFIATGFIDRATAMLQALTEFHFFVPENLWDKKENLKPSEKQHILIKEFKEFWDSGVSRIGDYGADGWSNVDWNDMNSETNMENEFDNLGSIKEIYAEEEKKELVICKTKGYSYVETRRRIDALRIRYFWTPVRFKHSDEGIYEYASRIIDFAQIKPILFKFSDIKLAEDLVFKLLHIFGVPIPGLNLSMQEDVLRNFTLVFPSMKPNSLKLYDFSKFIDGFVSLLAESPGIDSPRLCTAYATSITNSKESSKEKLAAFKKLVRGLNKRNRHSSNYKLPTEWQSSIFLAAFEELDKLREEAELLISKSKLETPKVEQSHSEYRLALEISTKVLYLNLDVKNRSIWDIGKDEHNELNQFCRKRERLLYLRFALYITRNLPFSDEKNLLKTPPIQIRDTNLELKTKREFLLSWFLTGKTLPVTLNETNIRKAEENVANKLKSCSPKDQNDLRLKWLGIEDEMVFELAALFFYEFPWRGHEIKRYTNFQNDVPLFTSVLAKSLNRSSKPREVRIDVLKHITRNSQEYNPRNLTNMLKNSVDEYPLSIHLLKTLLDTSNSFNQRMFLFKNIGKDNQTRFMRDCGRLYAEYIKLKKDWALKEKDDVWDPRELKNMLGRLIGIIRRIAEENSDNFIPDDYIWIFLMRLMIDAKVHVNSAKIEEVFNIGQKLIPWSKGFLYETARESTSAEGTTINGLTNTHGLNSYCTEEEVVVMLMNNDIDEDV